MKEGSYKTSMTLSKSSQEVFKCITDDVAKWWGGNDLSGSSAKLNDEFVINHRGSHYSKQIVTEFVPGKKLAWNIPDATLNWLKGNQHEWTDTTIVFELTWNGNGTRIDFIHEGLTPSLECYERVSQGWDVVIKDWLFNFVENGTPHFLP